MGKVLKEKSLRIERDKTKTENSVRESRNTKEEGREIHPFLKEHAPNRQDMS